MTLRGTERHLEALDAYSRHRSYRDAAAALSMSERTCKRLVYELRDLNGFDTVMQLAMARALELPRRAA